MLISAFYFFLSSLMTATHGDGSDIQLLLQLTLAYLLTTDKPKTGASEGLQKLTRYN
jgi:hypothetical protein